MKNMEINILITPDKEDPSRDPFITIKFPQEEFMNLPIDRRVQIREKLIKMIQRIPVDPDYHDGEE